MTCPICKHEGHDDQLTLCAKARGQARHTLQGFLEAIASAVKALAYNGDKAPRILLFVRKGNLTSVKVTVEVHRFDAPRTTIVVEDE